MASVTLNHESREVPLAAGEQRVLEWSLPGGAPVLPVAPVEPVSPVTYAFLHGDIWHILFNMIALWQFGPRVERLFGTSRFVRFYLYCTLGGAVLHFAAKTRRSLWPHLRTTRR